MSREALLARIRDDIRRGATELARDALAVLDEFAQGEPDDALDESVRFAHELARARPTMCAIAGILNHCLAQLGEGADDARTRVHQAVAATLAWSNAATEAAVERATAKLRSAEVVLTHSRSSTVEAVLMRLAPPARVVATESRPGLEGHVLAQRIAAKGAEVELITEAQIGLMVPRVDAILVGADAILANGAVVNKVGTHLLALAAHEARVPFYVCAESFKLSDERELPAEEHDPGELQAPAQSGVRARNFYFEATPAALISAYLSDVVIEDHIELASKRR